ncbi:SRPBCC family protein [Bacillus marasmi]|uniref:SRPBCC family protein n=1 Tax=Bacillus marasmi TaxID=1926279 RepID=UPI00164DE4C2|nr:SRPBCC family protein [Bacillus marasmi]
MLADIIKKDTGCIVRFERMLNHSAEEIWPWLTENERLPQWFPELRIETLQKGGRIKFDMGDGSFEEMVILDLEIFSMLEFTWGEDTVRFEITKKDKDHQLTLIENINKITNHTAKDVAGWHVCLDVIEHLLNGEGIQSVSRMDLWKTYYGQYDQKITEISG